MTSFPATPRTFRSLCQLTQLLAFMAIATGLLISAATARGEDVLPVKVFSNLRAGQKQTVVVYGTSLTAGGAWAVAMKEWFEAQFPGQVSFYNAAGPGQNSDWGLLHLQERVLSHLPDLVVVEFSYNDAHEKFKMPVSRGAANLGKIVDAIKASRPDCDIALQVMNVGWDAPNGKLSQSARPELSAFNENYRTYAAAKGLPFIDHFSVWLKLKESDQPRYQRFVPDGTHPSKEGSLAVTWPTIKALLERADAAAKRK